MVTNECVHSPRQSGISLAMLDFVAWPRSLTCIPIRRQWRSNASPLQLAFLCALGLGITGCKVAASNSAPSRAVVRQERQAE
jgi:hypothetical protein